MNTVVENKINEIIYLINLDGRLDSATAPEFERFFLNVYERGHIFLLLDASSLEYVTSRGIVALIRSLALLNKKNGAAAFVGVNEEVALLLGFFQLEEQAPHFPTPEEAQQYLNKKIVEYRSHRQGFEGRPLGAPLEGLGGSENIPLSGNFTDDDTPRFTVNASPTETEFPISFAEPEIVNCAHCSEQLRVYRSGRHLCPVCHQKFGVKSDGSVIFV